MSNIAPQNDFPCFCHVSDDGVCYTGTCHGLFKGRCNGMYAIVEIDGRVKVRKLTSTFTIKLDKND